MAQLKKEIKLFIVRELAVFNTPSEVAAAVKQEFKVEITRQRCESYDPTKRVGHNLSDELKAEFEATRKAFLAAPQDIPISNLSYRQARRQKVLEGAKAPMIILDVLDRAAKDMGGVFTNRQEVTGADGSPLLTEGAAQITLSPDQIKDLSAQDLAKIYFATGGK
ncbi:MAG: DUF2280 domain-containing protein [Pseudomonadota bacterium]|nr:DUF2280 domain-containing protein [Pseudomonadota bacterium]